jgi:ketosteroid isomerase-like protein
VAALAAGDADAVHDFFAPDATWWLGGDLPISGTWSGRDTIMADFFGTAMAHYEPGSVSLEVTGMVAEGDQVTLEWTSRAPLSSFEEELSQRPG